MRVLALLAAAACSATAADIVLDAGSGLSWPIHTLPNTLYALGQPLLRGKPVDHAAVPDGIAFWRHQTSFLVVPVLASRAAVAGDKSSAVLEGFAALPASGNAGGTVTHTAVVVAVDLLSTSPTASLSVSFHVGGNADYLEGWQLCLKWAQDGPSPDTWRAQGYPKASNESHVQADNLNYMGWPGFFLYRPNASVVAWWGLSITEEFTNPHTWTGGTSFWMDAPGGGQRNIAPQYAFGGGNITAGVWHNATTRLLFSDAGETLAAVREIVPTLLKLDKYQVETLAPDRSKADMLACFVNARRATSMWKTTPNGSAYQLQDIANFVYLGTTPESAYFEYQLYVETKDQLWRNRSFEQMAFWLQGQLTDKTSRHFGAVNTAYELPNGPYDSLDRGSNTGWKPDINAHMARYALLLWEAVKTHEGASAPAEIDTWFTAARLAAEWVYNMASDQAGGPAAVAGSAGLPQKIFPADWKDPALRDKPFVSATSGRYMNSLPVFSRLLTAEVSPKHDFKALQRAAEKWAIEQVEGLLYWFGQHPDLPDLEQDSVWELIEYWLDRHDAGDPKALDRAVGDGYVALMMLCPKQLSWVQHPTQGAADEQPEYNQYSVYTYHNRKWLVAQRLADLTKDSLWQGLADRIYALNAYVQVTNTTSLNDLGGFHEAIADPWVMQPFRTLPTRKEIC